MLRYILTRLAGLIGVLLAVSALTFFLMHAIPGGPFDVMGGDKAVAIPEETRRQLMALYGLDRPVWQQYLIFLRNAAHLDFGYSFTSSGRTVLEIIRDQWPYSIQLGLLTLAFSTVVGMGLGIGAGVRPNSWIDHLGTTVSIVCLVVPSFVFAVLLQFVFAVKLQWVPTGGWDSPRQWILPVLANSLGPILTLQRYTRSAVAEALHAPHVRTARAKGLSGARILFVHVLRNALTPIVTVAGPLVAHLIVGSFFVESIFRIPGIGFYWVTAIANRDYPMIMASTMVWTVLISLTYMVTDVLYALIDPRVRLVSEA
ncbi:MAG: ABC transporter permease [Chloroflexi bacterium]|nr:ABC transporter permease [Chloroflexota bacterium]